MTKRSCEYFPYGVVGLTLLYLVVVLVVEFVSPVECLDEPCNSEGLDNTVLGWATDFLIALLMMIFGLQLWAFTRRPVYFSAVLALISMGVAYVLGGVGHSIFTNSGYDDNTGQQGYYISWAVSFTFMTLSVEETYRFTRQVLNQYAQFLEFRRSGCLQFFLQLSFFLVVAAWIVTTGGYIWCATDSDLHVDETLDDVPSLDFDNGAVLEECLQMARIGEVSWYTTFSLFWIPVGILLRRVILTSGAENDQPRRVYGLKNSTAALLVTIIPWTFGIMFIVWSGVAAIALDKDATDVYANTHGAVIHHFGMVLGYFLFHNLAYSLPRDENVVPPSSASAVNNNADPEYARPY